ncbi:GGDEF domain-containing protein [Actimicrobium antarcticum]|uniref:diguanylate cyclase n=1 Tax=Actimicrobium antarcticum TaxID=1051899 RepID=A0ABP7T544_9BURK
MTALREQLAAREEDVQRLRTDLAELAHHDALTGALSRRILVEALEVELLRVRRTGHPLCFAIIDLDHFQAVNAHFGEAVGDLVLKAVAHSGLTFLRSMDRFGRLGGEEFGILMPSTWLDSATTAIMRLHACVAACDWSGMTQGMPVTFSAGLTTNAPGDTAGHVLLRAEDALLQAKLDGRNRTVVLEQPLPDMVMTDE